MNSRRDYAGIEVKWFWRWKKDGENEQAIFDENYHQKCRDFSQDIQEARAEYKVRCLAKMEKLGHKHFKPLHWKFEWLSAPFNVRGNTKITNIKNAGISVMKIKSVVKQIKSMSQTWGCRLWCALCQPNSLATLRLFLLVSLIGLCGSALADGDDILAGTDASLWATLNGTGKKYIYAAEGILGLAGYMKTKNLVILSGIVVVSIFFNIILSMAGESA